MHELKLHAVYYIRMEEMKTLRNKFCIDFHLIDRKTNKLPPKADFRPREPKPPRYSTYAPRSAPWSHILDEALQTNFIPLPHKILSPPNADITKNYKYHRNNAHTTNECKALQDKIEELIRADHLRQFVKRKGEHNSGPAKNRDSTRGCQNDHRH